MKTARLGTAVALVLAVLSSATACPVCESQTGQQVRAGIFNQDFGTNLLLTLLPFPVFLLLVALIHFGFPWPRGTTAEPGTQTPTAKEGQPCQMA